jgi:hypothetical protein
MPQLSSSPAYFSVNPFKANHRRRKGEPTVSLQFLVFQK